MVAIRKTKAKEEFGPDPVLDLPNGAHLRIENATLFTSIAVYDDIDPCKPWLHERLPKPFGISVVRR